MPKRKQTTASKIRALDAQGLDAPAITRELGCARQEVHQALRVRAVRGRPSNSDPARVQLRLPRALVEQARAIAERDGYSLQDWLHGCVIAGVQDAQAQAEIRALKTPNARAR
jgi:hypothetical protein